MTSTDLKDYSNTSLQKGIDLVTKATQEDTNRNYEDALKLYEKGIEHFLDAIKSEATGEKAKEAIRNKSLQYLERATKIKEYLSNKARKIPDDEGESSTKSNRDDAASSDGRLMLNNIPNSLQKAAVLAVKATKQDTNRNYEEARKLYEEALKFFADSMEHETQSEDVKEAIRKKALQYLDRLEKINEYLYKPAGNEESDSKNERNDDSQAEKLNSSEIPITKPQSINALLKAVNTVTRAVEEDKNGNYKEALKLYEQGVEYFAISIEHEIVSEKCKAKAIAKSLLYSERVEIIKKYLFENEPPSKDDKKGLPRKTDRNCRIL